MAFCGAPVLNPVLINWFGKRRGLAIGLGQIGGGLSFAYGLLIESVISWLGWRPAYLVMAGILVAILLPLFIIFLYHRPEDKGLIPYGTTEQPAIEGLKAVESTVVRDWTLRSAIKTYQLWFLVFSQFCYWGIGNYLVLAHQIKFAMDAGYSSILAASVFALFGIVSIAGQIAASMSDKVGREITVTLATVLAVGALTAYLLHKTVEIKAVALGKAAAVLQAITMGWIIVKLPHAEYFYYPAGGLTVASGIGYVQGAIKQVRAAEAAGFKFSFPDAGVALKNLLS